MVQPFHAIDKPGHCCCDTLTLHLAQIGAALQHQVAVRQPVRGQFLQQVGRQLAGAGASLKDVVRTQGVCQFGDLVGETAGKQ